MKRLLADENFNGHAFRGILRFLTTLDLVRAQDVGLAGKDDPTVLAWAASEGRVLLTHDKATIPRYAYERVAAGLAMPGVIVIPNPPPSGTIDDLALLVEASLEGEWEGQVRYLPLR